MVMLILKRHYQFWFSILALHKIGAVAIPGTHLLTKKDFVYRYGAAHVKAIVCTGHGPVAEQAELAEEEYHDIQCRIMVNGHRDGWLDFDEGVEKASEELERIPNSVWDPHADVFYFRYYRISQNGAA